MCHMILNTVNICLANVYMPCDDRGENVVGEYQTILGELQATIESANFDQIVCAGDFNADPSRGRLWYHLIHFVDHNQFTVNDLTLPIDSFSFLSPAHNTTSWLDHVISSSNSSVSNVKIDYTLSLFDHFPLLFSINVTAYVGVNCSKSDDRRQDLIKEFVDWSKFGQVERDLYNSISDNELCNIDLCNDRDCFLDHSDLIDSNYETIIFALKEGTKPFQFSKNTAFNVVPGWNKFCKNKYRIARDHFLKWLREGKIRYGPLYEQMKCSRKVFVNALNYCKRNKNISNALLANSLNNKNYVQFWKEVKKRRGADRGTASVCIDGVKSPPKIAQKFADKFSAVSGQASSTVHNYYLNVHPSNSIKFTERDVKNAIAQLKTGIGFDGVHSNHLKFASEYAVSILTMFLNSCLFHNYFPSNLLEGVINPILKNKLGDKCASSNYREVMISSNIFKVMEYLISYCHF